MNTNTYDKGVCEIPDFISLGITMDYPVRWGVRRIIRDFIQNFYDSIGYEHFAEEFEYRWEIMDEDTPAAACSRYAGQLHIRMRTPGHTFSYEWLSHIGGSTKTGKSGYAGKYGEGFKIALLCLVKLGGDAEMSSGRWKLRPYQYMEEIEDRKIEMFGYRMEEREDDGFTMLDLYGLPASDENLRYAREALLEFFFPENELFGDAVETAEDYALYGRSDKEIPCMEHEDIQGVFYYQYIARGRLPFPAVVHIQGKLDTFECDRSREILSEATVAAAVYTVAEQLSPKASLWLLMRMEAQWKDTPKFKRKRRRVSMKNADGTLRSISTLIGRSVDADCTHRKMASM